MCKQLLAKNFSPGSRFINSVLIGLSAMVLVSISMLARADVCDVIYGVQDYGLNNTQFVTIDRNTLGVIDDLGSLYPEYDIEGLDLNAAKELYVSSGDNTDKPGYLFKVNPLNGDIISELGPICFDHQNKTVCGTEISAISFNPNGGLWGWSEECGLVKVNITNPSNSTLVFPYATDDFVACLSNDPKVRRKYSSHIEDLTWDNTGETVYVANGGNVEKYSVTESGGNVTATFLETYAIGGNVETVEMLPDGVTLIIGQNNSTKLKTLSGGVVTEAHADLGKYNDIEAIAACVSEAPCVMGDTDGWLYTTDYVADATGISKLEIFGMALKKEGETITVAINSNMSPDDPLIYKGENVNFTDLVLDFAGTKYAVHFAPDNDSSATQLGLYANITLKDVTKKNYGWKSFKSYNRGDLGDLPIHNAYFDWEAKRSVPQEIASGDKVANDNFTLLNASELSAAGLDFAGGLTNGTGTHTFGFSFTRAEDMVGPFISYVFTECINDGVAMVNQLPACPGDEPPPVPVISDPVPEPDPVPDYGDIDEYAGNADCPAGSNMMAKFEWSGNSYTEDGDNLGVTINALTSDASKGNWNSTSAISYIIVKGGDNAGGYSVDATEGTFSNIVIPLNGGGNIPDISNIKFCGPMASESDPDPDPVPTGTNTVTPDPDPTSQAEDVDYVAQVTLNEGSATIDGDIDEWNIDADFSANMCTAGSVVSDGNCGGNGDGKVNLSDMYSRYDCATNTVYMLVLENNGYTAEETANNAWVTVGGNRNKVVKGSSGNDGNAPDFSWVRNESGRAIGYEASFPLTAGTYDNVQVHLNVSNNTSSTGKNGDTMSISTPTACP